MTRKFLMAFLFCVSAFSYGQSIQETENKILQDERVLKLVSDFADFYTSDFYNDYRKGQEEFVEKMSSDYFRDNDKPFEEWIQLHLSETKFSSVEEAVAMNKKTTEEFLKLNEKTAELDTLRYNLAKEYDSYVFTMVYESLLDKQILLRMLTAEKEKNKELSKNVMVENI